MGLDTFQSRRDRAKLKWWYKLATLPEDRYPKQLFNQEWNIKPRRGRHRKVRSRMVNDLFKSLGIDKSEWLEDIERGDSSSASFLACVEECISERESRRFEEGLTLTGRMPRIRYIRGNCAGRMPCIRYKQSHCARTYVCHIYVT